MSTKTNKKWNKFDTAWVLNLFGTAVAQGYYFYQSMQGWAVSGHWL